MKPNLKPLHYSFSASCYHTTLNSTIKVTELFRDEPLYYLTDNIDDKPEGYIHQCTCDCKAKRKEETSNINNKKITIDLLIEIMERQRHYDIALAYRKVIESLIKNNYG